MTDSNNTFFNSESGLFYEHFFAPCDVEAGGKTAEVVAYWAPCYVVYSVVSLTRHLSQGYILYTRG